MTAGRVAGGRMTVLAPHDTFIERNLERAGIRSWHLHGVALTSVSLSLGLWVRAKTVDQEQRGNAERRALFIGLWPATFYLLGDSLERYERRRRRWWS
jgi:hypothetical protein